MEKTLYPGSPHPLGATWDGEGVNFALYAEHANEYRDFNLFRFRDDLLGSAGKEAFKKDLQDVK